MVEKDAYCQELSRYIHLNPVRAGLVKRPSEYAWSSYQYYIGLKKAPKWLDVRTVLVYFSRDMGEARKSYREFTGKAIGEPMESPLENVFASTFLGSEKFMEWAKDRWIGFKNADERNIPVLKQVKGRPSLKEIGRSVSLLMGKKEALCRKFCLYISQQYGGYRLKEIGQYYNMRGDTVSQSNLRFRAELDRDRRLKRLVGRIIKDINVKC